MFIKLPLQPIMAPNPAQEIRDRHKRNVLAGHRGTLKNPNATFEARKRSLAALEEANSDIDIANSIIGLKPAVTLPPGQVFSAQAMLEFRERNGMGPKHPRKVHAGPGTLQDSLNKFYEYNGMHGMGKKGKNKANVKGKRRTQAKKGVVIGNEAERHEARVVAGYKAALKNPRTSNVAKENARSKIEEFEKGHVGS